MVTDLPDYEKKVVVVTIQGDYPAEMKVDHRKILGEALKTPTFTNCVPTSIENDALAYDPTLNQFYVNLAKISATDVLVVSAIDLDIRALTSVDVVTVKSITDALPAGSNAIGKLAANSGVDIGDVDVLSLPATVLAGMTTLPAGTNAIGKLAANSGVDIGDVDVASLPSLPAGTNAIGKLAANDGVNIGHVDVVTMPDVTQATAANLKATVTQAEKDRTISDVTKTATIVSVQATASGNTTIQTPAGGKKIRVKLIDVWNSGTAAITVYLRFAAAGTARFKKTLAANTGFIINLIGTNWEGAADEALIVNLSATGTVDVTAMKDEV